MEKEKEKIPGSVIALVGGIIIALISLWVGQNHGLMPEQASEQAPLVDGFFNVMVTIGTALFVVVEGTIVLFAIKFRQPKGDETDGVAIAENIPLELFWTAIPAILVIGLGVYSVEVYRDMGGFEVSSHHHSAIAEVQAAPLAAMPDEGKYGIGASPQTQGKPVEVEVNVTGMQYAWIFNYSDTGIVSGELHVPVGKTVQLNISSTDVIHSFWVPQFRIKQDAIPGIPTELRFVATKTGDYPVVCTELCGGYHGGMRTRAIVHTPEDYDRWVGENQIAQQSDLTHAIARNPKQLSESEFLEPYSRDLGIDAEILAQIQPAQS